MAQESAASMVALAEYINKIQDPSRPMRSIMGGYGAGVQQRLSIEKGQREKAVAMATMAEKIQKMQIDRQAHAVSTNILKQMGIIPPSSPQEELQFRAEKFGRLNAVPPKVSTNSGKMFSMADKYLPPDIEVPFGKGKIKFESREKHKAKTRRTSVLIDRAIKEDMDKEVMELTTKEMAKRHSIDFDPQFPVKIKDIELLIEGNKTLQNRYRKALQYKYSDEQGKYQSEIKAINSELDKNEQDWGIRMTDDELVEYLASKRRKGK